MHSCGSEVLVLKASRHRTAQLVQFSRAVWTREKESIIDFNGLEVTIQRLVTYGAAVDYSREVL